MKATPAPAVCAVCRTGPAAGIGSAAVSLYSVAVDFAHWLGIPLLQGFVHLTPIAETTGWYRAGRWWCNGKIAGGVESSIDGSDLAANVTESLQQTGVTATATKGHKYGVCKTRMHAVAVSNCMPWMVGDDLGDRYCCIHRTTNFGCGHHA